MRSCRPFLALRLIWSDPNTAEGLVDPATKQHLTYRSTYSIWSQTQPQLTTGFSCNSLNTPLPIPPSPDLSWYLYKAGKL
jgi:hypothetical protein